MEIAAGACAICGFGLAPSRYVRLADAALRRCGRCGSVLYWPRPDSATQNTRHDNSEYFEHPYLQLRRNGQQRLDQRCADVFTRLSSVMEINSLAGKRHLDVGCDTGAFLQSAARQFGIVPVGVDIAKRSVAEAKTNGLEAYACALESAPAEVADIALITAIDVIEHVPDPRGFLQAVAARLAASGVCYLETPNIESVVYRTGRQLSNWTAGYPAALVNRLFPSEHIQYLSVAGLRELAGQARLEVVAVGRRLLPAADIAVSRPVRVVLSALQSIDRLIGTEILHWAILRRESRTAR